MIHFVATLVVSCMSNLPLKLSAGLHFISCMFIDQPLNLRFVVDATWFLLRRFCLVNYAWPFDPAFPYSIQVANSNAISSIYLNSPGAVIHCAMFFGSIIKVLSLKIVSSS
jgi:hypothetical protein